MQNLFVLILSQALCRACFWAGDPGPSDARAQLLPLALLKFQLINRSMAPKKQSGAPQKRQTSSWRFCVESRAQGLIDKDVVLEAGADIR
jgi:hypothetical protein